MRITAEWLQGAEWGAALTIAAYAGALVLRGKIRRLHPLFTGSVAVIALLLLTGISYEEYRIGGDLLVFMLGPATVALGVPIYKHGKQLRRQFPLLLAGVTTGSIAAIVSSWLFASLFGLPPQILYSMLPKSVTTAVSIELAEQLGGVPELAALLTVLTGLLGSMFGPAFLRMAGVRGDLPVGTALGTASHGIGTARLVADSERQGSVSALAMSISCIVTPLLMLPLYWWF